MVTKKPKIIETLLPGVSITKVPRQKEPIPSSGTETSYEGERCNDDVIPVEMGNTYYGGYIDTKEIVDDVLSSLGM